MRMYYKDIAKKKIVIYLILIVLMRGAFPNVSMVADYPQEAKAAGYSYEEYQSIMSIPRLKEDQFVGENTAVLAARVASVTPHDAVVNMDLSYRGVPYVWGGNKPQWL